MKRSAEAFIAFVLSFSLFLSPTAPAFAQLGDPLPPAPDPTPAAETTVEPVVEAVTPPADTTPPVIASVVSASLLQTTAEIAWTTDELSVSHLRYGTTNSLGSTATLPATTLLVHATVLTGLTPGTTYHYCIDATDLTGNVATSCGHTFATAAEEPTIDANPPTVSSLSLSGVTSSSVTIAWTTDEVADAQLEYGLTSDYGSVTDLNPDLELAHTITLTGLLPNTTYHYRVRSSDELGNVSVSNDENFTTAPLADAGQGSSPGSSGSPSASSGSSGDETTSSIMFSSIESASITTTGVTITWHTDVPTDSQVEYGESELFGSVTPLSAVLTTSHSVSISGLTPNTNYFFRVKSKPAGALVSTVSSNHEFNTLSVPVFLTQPAHVNNVGASFVTTSGATITWTTDVGATSQVEYGITTAYGQHTTANDTLATAHSVALSHLTPDTTYHYRVRSETQAGDITYSDDHSFATPTVQGSVGQGAPMEIANLSVLAHDQTSATLRWHISDEADAAARYEIRYATFQITDSSYAQATPAQETSVVYADLDPTGTSRSYIVAGLSPGTTYYFAIKSKYEHSDWSHASNISSITTSAASRSSVASTGGGGGGGTPASHAPTLINAAGEDGQVVLNWRNPKEDSYVHTVIIRKKEGSYPASPQDGEAIYEGRSETFTDTSLENSKTYYYSMYSFDHAKRYSSPVHVSLSPKSGAHELIVRENPALVSTGPIEHFVREFKRGDKDIEVEHLQRLLIAESVYPFNRVTGYFGRYTEEGMKKLQAKHGLPQSGTTDVATRALLEWLSAEQVRLAVPGDALLLATNLREGAKGGVVEALQEFLFREGSYRGKITGSFDTETRTAVMAFQKKYNVTPVSGYVGPKTRHVIQTITGL